MLHHLSRYQKPFHLENTKIKKTQSEKLLFTKTYNKITAEAIIMQKSSYCIVLINLKLEKYCPILQKVIYYYPLSSYVKSTATKVLLSPPLISPS